MPSQSRLKIEGQCLSGCFSISDAWFGGAPVLALGIGVQDMLEGISIAMLLRCEGLGRWPAFDWGALSGVVEPIAAVLGA